MGATVLAILLATGLGLIAGGYYSLMGWIVVASLLFITTAIAVAAAERLGYTRPSQPKPSSNTTTSTSRPFQ